MRKQYTDSVKVSRSPHDAAYPLQIRNSSNNHPNLTLAVCELCRLKVIIVYEAFCVSRIQPYSALGIFFEFIFRDLRKHIRSTRSSEMLGRLYTFSWFTLPVVLNL